MDLNLDGANAVVTGGASGIGRAVATALLEEGAHVLVLDRDRLALDEFVQGAPSEGRLRGVVADVTDEREVADAMASATSRGLLDVAVFCAGISGPVGTPLAETDVADWRRVLDVNATSGFLCLKHAVPYLRSGSASVIFLASDSALVASPGLVPYCASKGAVLQLARAASVELAADGIRVNALCPSIVDTPMSRSDMDKMDGFTGVDYPVQTPQEVADQVLFLASPRSRPVNAAALVSDFGYLARTNFPI